MNNRPKSNFTKTDVEILKHDTAYQGYFRIERYQLRHRLFEGGWSNPLTREIFERGHAAAALLFDPVLNKIVLIEQFRIGTLNKTEHPWLLELIAGIIDAHETPESVAIRETQEEAGLAVLDLTPICEYWVSPGASTETVALFCARVDASHAGGTYGLPEEGEDIQVHVVDLQQAYDLLNSGHIKNAPTIIALQWLQLHEENIRKKWLKL